MIGLIAVVSVAAFAGSNAYKMSPVPRLSTRLYLEDMNKVKAPPAPPGYKPMADGTYKKSGDFLKEYVMEMDNGAKAICRTFGGNAFSYVTKDGIQVLGKRADAVDINSDSAPYAGGSPHCFPQFGPGALLQHGFARGMAFLPEERAKKLSFDRMIFKLVATEESKKIWDHDFEYRFDITLRADSLEWDVIIINEGDKPFDVTLGLHTYIDVSSLKNVVIKGPFTGKKTADRLTGTEGEATSDELTVTGPIDTVFKGVTGPITITDSGKGTVTTVEGKGYADRVIWSPFGNEAMGYDKFVCVEPVSVSPVTIPVGKFKETKFYQKISCSKI